MRELMHECSNGETSVKFLTNSPRFRTLGACFLAFTRATGALMPVPLKYSFTRHPQVRQHKHHQQLAGVLSQPPVTRLTMPKLALDDPKRMLHLGPDAVLEFFQLVTQSVAGFVFVQRFALARHHDYLPIHSRVLLFDLFALFNTPVIHLTPKRQMA